MTSEIGFLIRYKTSEAEARILGAIREAGGHKGRAATILGCRHGTLIAWINALKIGPTVESLIEKGKREGWYDVSSGGRPVGSRDATPRAKAPPRAKRANPKKRASPKKKAKAQATRANAR